MLAAMLVACGGSSDSGLFGSEADAGNNGAGRSADNDSGTEADGGEAGSGGGSAVCAPGKVEACACPSGSTGAQRCKDDGSGYEDCLCSDGDGGTTVPGWEWWCSENGGACVCHYAAEGDAGMNGCRPQLNCCIRYDVGGKPNMCRCTDTVSHVCGEIADLEGGSIVKRCPPQ